MLRVHDIYFFKYARGERDIFNPRKETSSPAVQTGPIAFCLPATEIGVDAYQLVTSCELMFYSVTSRGTSVS